MAKEESKNIIKVQKPNAEKIACKDCLNRDKTVVEINGKIIAVGVTRGTCDVYKGPPDDKGKPHKVLFNNARCDYFVKG